MADNYVDRRSESRAIIDQFYSVEFAIGDTPSLYQFKIWNMSSRGMCLLVKEGSDILKSLKVGDIVDMKYYTVEVSKPTNYIKTEIKHITKDDEGRFRGHYLIGISILEDQDS